jgi:hypothetical protein
MTPRTLWFQPRRRLASLLALAALAVLMLAPAPGPRVEQVLGRVEIGRGEPPTWRAARQGDALEPGDVVRTGHDGRAELMLAAGAVRLYGDTLLRLPAASAQPGKADAVELDQGSSLFDILRRGRDDFQVRTPEVVVSIKGTRFLVVAEERAEVAVFHGTVGLHRDSGPAHEMLVREGFAAVGGHGQSFELLWSGAPDPWEAWSEGGRPPRAPERSAGATEQTETLVEAAKEAAKQRSRGAAVKQAVDRHPELATRLDAVKKTQEKSDLLEAVPAQVDPSPITGIISGGGEIGSDGGSGSGSGSSGSGSDDGDHDASLLSESYVEAMLNGVPAIGQFEVNTKGDEVEIELGNQEWRLDQGELQDVIDGTAALPQLLVDAVESNGGSEQQLASKLLLLIND